MKIEIFGTGCPKCNALAEAAKEAAERLGVEYELVKISEIAEMAGRGVMMTPAMAVNGKIQFAGKVPPVEEIQEYLK